MFNWDSNVIGRKIEMSFLKWSVARCLYLTTVLLLFLLLLLWLLLFLLMLSLVVVCRRWVQALTTLTWVDICVNGSIVRGRDCGLLSRTTCCTHSKPARFVMYAPPQWHVSFAWWKLHIFIVVTYICFFSRRTKPKRYASPHCNNDDRLWSYVWLQSVVLMMS